MQNAGLTTQWGVSCVQHFAGFVTLAEECSAYE
jgi:hypothetical protein